MLIVLRRFVSLQISTCSTRLDELGPFGAAVRHTISSRVKFLIFLFVIATGKFLFYFQLLILIRQFVRIDGWMYFYSIKVFFKLPINIFGKHLILK